MVVEIAGIKSVEFLRGPCFGRCPADRVVLEADGTLVYTGSENVERLGAWKASISPDDFSRLARLIKKQKMGSLKTRYTFDTTDAPDRVVTVNTASGTQRVRDYGHRELRAVTAEIARIVAGATDWTKVSR